MKLFIKFALVQFTMLFLLAAAMATDDLQSEPSQEVLSAMSGIAGNAIVNNHASEYLEDLSDNVGGRVTGTPQSQQAIVWALEKMRSIGLENVHAEPFQLSRGWQRVSASAQLTSPIHRQLVVSSIGWFGSTPSGGVDGDVVPVNIYQKKQELTDNFERWTGKILLFVAQGESPSSFDDSLQRFATLSDFIRKAAAAHPLAMIVHQGDWKHVGMNLTHTGAWNFDTYLDVPVVSMTAEDRSQIERFLAHKKIVHLLLDVHNQISSGPVASSNVAGEIRGTTNPKEIVLLGAHLDSWDLAQGATDNGVGVAATLGAADAIISSGRRPKRTIRFVLFTGEEQGLVGSLAYVKSHSADISNYLAAMVLDNGQGPIVKLNLAGRNKLIPTFATMARSLRGLEQLGVDDKVMFNTDCGPFTLSGVPGINLEQESPEYEFTHHSEADTLDKIEPDVLARNAAVMALTAFWIADQPERLDMTWSRQQTAQMLTNKKLDTGLRQLGLWGFDDLQTTRKADKPK